METGKTGKYFKYAIGEIFLVVIGILIALQINNWNENRKQNLKDIEFLNGLRSELIIDTTNLSIRKHGYLMRNERMASALKSLDSIKKITSIEYQEMIDAFISMEVLTPVGKNLQKNDIALANGTLARIDQELNDNYLAYIELTKSNNEIIAKLGETLQQISVHHVMPSIDFKMDTIKTNIQSEFKSIQNNRLLRNTLFKSHRARNVHLSYMEGQIENATALIDSIDDFLINNSQESDN